MSTSPTPIPAAAKRHGTLGGMPSSSVRAGASLASMSAQERLVWRIVSESGQLTASILDRRLKDALGISHADYGVLRRLHDAAGEPVSMRTLRHEVWFSRSRLTHQLNRLISDGIVTKAGDVADGRLQVVALTDAGADAVVRAQQIVQKVLRDHFFDQLPDGAVDELAGLLTGLLDHLRDQPECQAFRNS